MIRNKFRLLSCAIVAFSFFTSEGLSAEKLKLMVEREKPGHEKSPRVVSTFYYETEKRLDPLFKKLRENADTPPYTATNLEVLQDVKNEFELLALDDIASSTKTKQTDEKNSVELQQSIEAQTWFIKRMYERDTIEGLMITLSNTVVFGPRTHLLQSDTEKILNLIRETQKPSFTVPWNIYASDMEKSLEELRAKIVNAWIIKYDKF